MLFLQYPCPGNWKFPVLNPPHPPAPLFVCFSGIAQCNFIAVVAFIPVLAIVFHDFKSIGITQSNIT